MTPPASGGLLRGEPWFFAAVALLLVVPFWSVHHVPTVDGPSHVYNAWLLHHLDDPELPALGTVFEIDPRPLPNWLGHALLYLLLFVASPATAEKLLVSGQLLLFLAAARHLAGSLGARRRLWGWMAIPLVYHQPFQSGFYNFSFGVSLALLAISLWWRQRHRFRPATVAGLHGLLLLCWFAHIVSLVVALIGIASLWIATWPTAGEARTRTADGMPTETPGNIRRHLLHLPLLLPQLALPFWFVLAERGAATGGDSAPPSLLLRYLVGAGVMISLDEWQYRLAQAVGALFVALALLGVWHLVTTRRGGDSDSTDDTETEGRGTERLPSSPATVRLDVRRAEIGFLLAVALMIGIFFLVPDRLVGGSLLKPRLSLFVYLLLLPALPPPGRWTTRALMVGGSLLAVDQSAHQTTIYRELDRRTDSFLAGLAPIAPGKRLVPLVFETGPLDSTWRHAAAYTAVDKALVDWHDYEAATTHFPIRFRQGILRPDDYQLTASPQSYPVQRFRDVVDYVYVWAAPPAEAAALDRRLGRHYERLSSGEGSLYRRRRGQAVASDPEPAARPSTPQ